ncbi:MAG: endonuclease/exonuclease/phosphatase family protein [Rikenellaceae bacterium]
MLLIIFRAEGSLAQVQKAQSIKAAFYNVENMFDTINDPFILDSEFTPWGRMHWDGVRYRAKVEGVARVVSEMEADIVALAEVENENVVKDLVATIEDVDYAYVHYNSSDRRGIDIAILYRPERFFIDSMQVFKIQTHRREIITLFGEVSGQKVIFSACHLPSLLTDERTRTIVSQQAAIYFDWLASVDSSAYCIIAGDFNATPSSSQMQAILDGETSMNLINAMAELDKQYTYAFGSKRLNFDYFLVGANLENKFTTNLFVASYLFDNELGKSMVVKPTYHSGSYVGGISDHLPIIIEINN